MENNKGNLNNKFTYYGTITDFSMRAAWENDKLNVNKTQYNIGIGEENDIPPGTSVASPRITTNNIEMADVFTYGSRVRVTIERV